MHHTFPQPDRTGQRVIHRSTALEGAILGKSTYGYKVQFGSIATWVLATSLDYLDGTIPPPAVRQPDGEPVRRAKAPRRYTGTQAAKSIWIDLNFKSLRRFCIGFIQSMNAICNDLIGRTNLSQPSEYV